MGHLAKTYNGHEAQSGVAKDISKESKVDRTVTKFICYGHR